MSNMEVIGLTGGIACGKSEVAGILAGIGVPVLDTDAVARSLLDPGHWVYEKVVQAFGREYTLPEGGIDRRKLGALVFTDDREREKLNAIVHPEVFNEIDRWTARQAEDHRRCVVMIPLLYETDSEDRFDRTIVVAATDDKAEERLIVRGFSRDEARARIDAQLPIEEKIRRADIVINNNGDLQDLRAETLKIWNQNILGKEEST